MTDEPVFFCRKPFCMNHLGATENCPKDGESSTSAGEKLRIDTDALNAGIKEQADTLNKGKGEYACQRCDFFSDKEGRCPAGHQLKTKVELFKGLEAYHREQTIAIERNIGLTPTPQPPVKKLFANTATSAYLSDLMRKSLEEVGIKDAVIINEWQGKAEVLEPDAFLVEAENFSPALNLTPIRNYIEATKIETLTATASVKYEVGEEVITAFIPSLTALREKGKTYGTLATDLNLSYEQIKNALRRILPDYFNNNVSVYQSEMLIPFFISKERCMSGQVISNLDGVMKSINLVTVFSDDGEFHYQFFGEVKPQECKKSPVFARYNELFYVYKFQSDNSEEIILLSPRELELSGCKIYGMEAGCYDFLKIGNMAKIATTQKVFFVHSQKPSIETISEASFWKKAAKYDKDKIYKAMFGKFPHPEWFAKFMMGWVFSGKLSDMPTHLSLMSPPALGKTKLLVSLSKAFGQSINDGGTIKGLVPSFANGVPKEGYLIKCRRFGFVDEFLHVIQSSARNGSDFDGGSYQLLKVLEHSEGEHSSAFGIIKAKPKMWVIFCSNIRPYEHIKNLVDLHEKLNVAFMSRILWYVYDQDHIKFFNQHKSEVMKFDKETSYPEHDTVFISLVDFMHSQLIDIPISVIEDIHAKYRPLVPAALELDIYDSRMIMHIYRIVDGYAKYKSLVEQRGRFVCTEQDIKEADEIVGRIIRSWSQNLDDKHMTPAMKLAYLDSAQREVFDFVKINQTTSSVTGGVDEHLMMKLKGVTAVQVADTLVAKGILKEVPGVGYKVYLTYDAHI